MSDDGHKAVKRGSWSAPQLSAKTLALQADSAVPFNMVMQCWSKNRLSVRCCLLALSFDSVPSIKSRPTPQNVLLHHSAVNHMWLAEAVHLTGQIHSFSQSWLSGLWEPWLYSLTHSWLSELSPTKALYKAGAICMYFWVSGDVTAQSAVSEWDREIHLLMHHAHCLE